MGETWCDHEHLSDVRACVPTRHDESPMWVISCTECGWVKVIAVGNTKTTPTGST